MYSITYYQIYGKAYNYDNETIIVISSEQYNANRINKNIKIKNKQSVKY